MWKTRTHDDDTKSRIFTNFFFRNFMMDFLGCDVEIYPVIQKILSHFSLNSHSSFVNLKSPKSVFSSSMICAIFFYYADFLTELCYSKFFNFFFTLVSRQALASTSSLFGIAQLKRNKKSIDSLARLQSIKSLFFFSPAKPSLCTGRMRWSRGHHTIETHWKYHEIFRVSASQHGKKKLNVFSSLWNLPRHTRERGNRESGSFSLVNVLATPREFYRFINKKVLNIFNFFRERGASTHARE